MVDKRQRWSRYKYWVSLALISLVGALVALYLFSGISFSVNSLELKLELLPYKGGETAIVIPPVGEVRATTHRAPFLVKLTLVSIKPDLLAETLSDLAENDGARQVKKQLADKIVGWTLRWAALAGLGGVGGWFLCNRRASIHSLLAAGGIAFISFLLLFGLTLVYPYDLDAFENPRYRGAIGAAPWVVDLVADSISNFKSAGEQLEVLSVHVRELCDRMGRTFPPTEDVPLTLLAVSDLHNNPAALNFMDKVIQTFKIDLIIDTGDITDYGTSLESELIKRIAHMPVPYLFVPGNHDNPFIVDTLREAGALVIDDQMMEIAGLRVLGLTDPASRNHSMKVAPEEELRAVGNSAFEELYDRGSPPDLVAAHNSLLIHDFIDRVPVIITGHTHRPEIKLDRTSWLINPGSVGAAGIRGLQSPGDNLYSLAILYFAESGEGAGDGSGDDRKLVVTAVDMITIPQLQGSFTVQRHYCRLDSDKK